MPRKINLKGKIGALLANGDVGSHALILDDRDVVLLLRAAIELEGNQVTFAKRHGLERTHMNAILNGRRLASGSNRRTLNTNCQASGQTVNCQTQ